MKKNFVFFALVLAIAFNAVGVYGQTDDDDDDYYYGGALDNLIDAKLCRDWAKKAYDEKRYDDAIKNSTDSIKYGTEALTFNPNFNNTAYFYRAMSYYAKKEYDKAIADFTTLIKLEPNDYSNYYGRGRAYSGKRDYDKAIADYTQSIRLNSNYADAYFHRGIAYSNKGDTKREIADYEAALKINPNHADAKRNLADAKEDLAQGSSSSKPSARPAQPSPPPPPAPVYVTQTCSTCKGAKRVPCGTCGGTGQIKASDAYTIPGYGFAPDMHMPAMYGPCWRCGGAKTLACDTCGGIGTVQVLQTAAQPAQPQPKPATPAPAPAPTKPDFEMNGTTLVKYNGKATTVTIPNNVKVIGEKAFSESGVKSVTIPSGVTTIGIRAFEKTALTSVNIPASVTTITRAFEQCMDLTSINVDAQNRDYSSVDGVVFSKDKKILFQYPAGKRGSYTIPAGVTTINDHAFALSQFTSVTIPSSVTSIGDFAFIGSSLKSVTIPSSVTGIGVYAFGECYDLTSVTLSRNTQIGDDAFPSGAKLTYIDPPKPDFEMNGTTLVKYNGKAANVTIPNNVKEIGEKAFAESGVRSVTIPSGVTTIGWRAFAKSALTSVNIPASVTSIGMAFAQCMELTSINVDAQNRDYSSVDGVLFTKDKKILLEYPAGKKGSNYTIPAGVTSISDQAFALSQFTSVTIPSSVTFIEDLAFIGSSLKSVTIPSSVTGIGAYAFGECYDLTSVTLSRNTQIGDDAFPSGAKLTYIDPPKPDFEMNGTTLVKYNGKAANVTIPSNVTVIGEKAFSYCDKITSVNIPPNVTTIGDWAFSFCEKLTNINIPPKVTTIGKFAFAYCKSLTSITIPPSVISIGQEAFGFSDDLKTVTLSRKTTVSYDAFHPEVQFIYSDPAPPVQPDKAAYDRGREAHGQNNYDRAITEFTEAIRLNPNYELAYFYRADAYAMKDEYDRALTDINQALRISPNDDDNYTLRGNVYFLKNDYNRAVADYNQALKINPNNADAKRGLELVQQRKQNSTPAAAPVQPAAPTNTASVNPNAIPLTAWGPSDGESPGVTKRGSVGREVIEGQQRDVLTMEVTFPRQTQAGGTGKWGAFTINDEFNLSKIRTATGVRFKAMGDGKRWIIQFHTKESMTDWGSYEADIKTVPNRVVEINIPYSSLAQPSWGKKVPFVKSNIMSVNLQRMTDNASETGPSTLKVFDFEVYSGSEPAAAPTINVNPNFIPPSLWKAGGGDAPGVTKKIFNNREVIAGQEKDVLTMEATFPRQNGSKWATFDGPWDEPYLSRLRAGSGIRFKALGDGKRWIIQFIMKVSGEDCCYEAEIKTTNNRVVDINIPYSSLKQADWGKKAPWNKNNIAGVNIQRNSSDSGNTSTLKVFDFEVY